MMGLRWLTLASVVAMSAALAPPRMLTPPCIKAAASSLWPAAVATIAAQPMAAVAEDYEYGAVAAPGWVLPLGAVLAIATALLPLVLRAGDDAQREMAERDSDTFGKGRSPLDKR